MKRTNNAFTIVELLIVIVVIAVLAAISIVAYNGIQVRTRDAHRVSDVDAVKKFVELYYVQNGYYPRSDHFLDANASAAMASGPLKGLPAGALRAPAASSSTVSSWGQWAGNVTTDGYDYSIKTFTSANTDCISSAGRTDQDCTRYEIYYRVESNNSYKLINSLAGQ